jgi:hypothetical protein
MHKYIHRCVYTYYSGGEFRIFGGGKQGVADTAVIMHTNIYTYYSGGEFRIFVAGKQGVADTTVTMIVSDDKSKLAGLGCVSRDIKV